MPRAKDPEKQIATAERNRHIIELRRANMHWKDIADEVGLAMSTCHEIFSRYQHDIPASAIAGWREEQLDLLQRGVRRLLAIATDDRRDNNGKLIISAHSQVQAWQEIRQHGESLRKMLGVDAPQKREIEIFDTSGWEAEARLAIAETERELRASGYLKDNT